MFQSLKYALPFVMFGAAAQAQDAPPINQLDFEPICAGENLVGVFSGCVMVPVAGIKLYAPDKPVLSIPMIFAPSCFQIAVTKPEALPLLSRRFQFAGIPDSEVERTMPLAQSTFEHAELICGEPKLGS